MTVYAGTNTVSNVVQTPASCTGCSPDMGSVHDDGGLVWYFTPEERAQFSTLAPGEMGNTGRNFFRGPGGYFINLSLAKRTRSSATTFWRSAPTARTSRTIPSSAFRR